MINRAARENEARLRIAVNVRAWLAGSDVAPPVRLGRVGRWGVMDTLSLCRVKGDMVETSGHARVKLSAARALCCAIIAGRDVTGSKVDGFRVVSQTTRVLTVGCHKISMSMIRHIAREQNWGWRPSLLPSYRTAS